MKQIYMFLLFIIFLIFSGCDTKKGQKSELFVNIEGNVSAGIIFYDNCMLVAKDGELLNIKPDKTITVFCSLKDLPAGKNYFFKSPLIWNMAIDKNKNIIAAAQDRLLKISPDGKIETLIAKDFGGLGIRGVDIDNLGNIYITGGSKILKYTPDMEESVFIDATGINESFIKLFALKFTKDKKFIYVSNVDLEFNSSALLKIPVEPDGKAGKPEIIIDKDTEYLMNNKKVKWKVKANLLNILFSNKGNLIFSIDYSGLILKITKSGKKELIDMKGPLNHCIAFGTKGFKENALYYTTFDGKGIYEFQIGEKEAR